MSDQEQAVDRGFDPLSRLLRLLKQHSYAFVTPTPSTHALYLDRRKQDRARSVEDVLGWSMPFVRGTLPADIELCLREADVVHATDRGEACSVRVSSLDDNFYLHSAYPTDSEDAVFFGPDSYRFAAVVARDLTSAPPKPGARIVDIGTGAGVGAITAASICPSASIVMTDVNRRALRFAEINAQAAGVAITPIEANGLNGIEGLFDVAIINPPYIIDEAARTYRDGGGMLGAALSIELAQAALARLSRGGRLILYTGSAIVEGQDRLRTALSDFATAEGSTFAYTEIDPDVFGEELSKPQYRAVDRIALVVATIGRSA